MQKVTVEQRETALTHASTIPSIGPLFDSTGKNIKCPKNETDCWLSKWFHFHSHRSTEFSLFCLNLNDRWRTRMLHIFADRTDAWDEKKK